MPERGFTLLEIMLVIFLIGLASSGVVQTFATDSEPPAKKAAQDFLTRFAQFKDRAVIEGQTLGVLIDAPGYQFMQRRQGQWLPVSATRLSAQVTVPKQVQMLLQPGSDIWQKEYLQFALRGIIKDPKTNFISGAVIFEEAIFVNATLDLRQAIFKNGIYHRFPSRIDIKSCCPRRCNTA